MKNSFASTTLTVSGPAQDRDHQPVPLRGKVERLTVHGKSLEGNLIGDPAERDIVVYLPPSYVMNANRRYPVVYLLHGFTDSEDRWFGFRRHFVNAPVVMEKSLGAGTAKEMILVMPNAFNAFQGSMYSNSVTTGNWEAFVAEDLVEYIDAHYRTIPNVDGRGLAGHSMGGYGAIRIAMKQPEVFSSIYLISPCCMRPNLNPNPAQAANAAKARSVRDIPSLDFSAKAMLATAAAWSPNPKKPPLYLDLPVVDGEVQTEVVARWAANSPIAMVDQHIPNLKKLRAIAMDAGAQDTGIAEATRVLDGILTQYDINHSAEIYDPGAHTSHVAERLETHVLPFFSNHLSFTAAVR